MPQIIEQFKADTYLPHPEHGGTFCRAEDGFIYLVVGGDQSYWVEKLQPIRKGLSFQETILWEQFVRTGYETPPGPRGGHLTFSSIKKAIAALEAEELEWIPSPYVNTESDRQAAYAERTANDYLPSKARWALSKGKEDSWVCKKAGIESLQQPWAGKDCPLAPLLARS